MIWQMDTDTGDFIMHYVYFLKMSNGQVYTGSTGNLKQRLANHISGKVSTTSKYLPTKLVGYEAYLLKSDALRREKYLKTTEGKRLLRQQYRDIITSVMPR